MSNPYLYIAGEDIDISNSLVAFGSTGVSVDTTSGDFRSGFGRYGLDCLALQSFVNWPFLDAVNLPLACFASASFWTSGRFVCRASAGSASNGYGGRWLQWLDASGNVRLQIRSIYSNSTGGAAALPPTTCVVEKLGAPIVLSQTGSFAATNVLIFASVPASIVAGMQVRDLSSASTITEGISVISTTSTTVTISATIARQVGHSIQFQSVVQLGTQFSGVGALASAPLKVDVYINYGASGQFTLYQGEGGQRTMFSYFGDLTMDGNTSLGSVLFGQLAAQYLGTLHNVWSEMIVSSADTRMQSVWTRAAVANGNADTFTVGAAGNVNGNTATYSTFDYSLVAAQIQEYTATGAPAGTYTVQTVQETGVVSKGTSGPSHLQYLVRVGGVDYPSGTLAPTAVWSRMVNYRDVNPNTGIPWTVADLTAVGFNLGYESQA